MCIKKLRFRCTAIVRGELETNLIPGFPEFQDTPLKHVRKA